MSPSRSPLRSLRPVVLAAAAALFAAACDQATSPAGRALPAPRHDGGADDGAVPLAKPALFAARVRYRDRGHHAATGRAGTASLSMRALLGRDGTTELQVSTADVGTPWITAPGRIERVQSKAFSPDGHLLATRVHTAVGAARASFEYRGLARGAVLQVQAGVRGVDGARTDVVSATDPVVLRPNLRAMSVGSGPRVPAGEPVNVAATIRETNGDVGNWGDCTLYVDGAAVDAAKRIWVDAGDAVTCAFTHTFSAGAHRLEVRVDASAGAARDDDPADNAAAATVTAITPTALAYSLYAMDLEQRDSTVFTQHGDDGAYTVDLLQTQVTHTRAENVFLNLSTPRVLAGSHVRLDVQERSGGAIVHARVYALTLEGSEPACAYGMGEGNGARIYLCTGGWNGGTYLFYDRYAGRVTYHSVAYVHVWDHATGEETVYSYNDASDDGGTPTPFTGSDFAMRVRLYDAANVYGADPSLTLSGRPTFQVNA